MSAQSPNEIDTLNFEEVGIRWTVRQSSGERLRFVNLAALQDALDAGELTHADELTFDGNIWRNLSDIPDLRAYFWQVWKRAQRGEIQADWMPTIGGLTDIHEDAPTTIAAPDSELSQAIQEALSRELMARSLEKLPPSPQVHDPSAVEPLKPAAPEPAAAPEPTPEPAHTPAPDRADHHPAPQPSDIPGILRAMVVSLLLVDVAILLLLSLP